MLHASSLLALTLLAHAPEQRVTAAGLESVVRRAQSAVEAGRDSAERVEWGTRLETDGAHARLARATIDRLTYRYADAERAYVSLAADLQAGDAVRAYATLGLGLLHLQRARLRDAEPLLRQTADRLDGPDARAGRAQALTHLAVVIARTVSIDSALATFAIAERTVLPGDAWLRTLVRCNALVAQVRSAERTAASRARAEARAAIGAGNRRAAAACLAALAQDQERRSMQDSAMATFREVAELQRATRNFSSLAVTLQWQGYVRRARGDVVGARPLLEEAVALGRQTEALAASSWAELSLADVALSFGDLPAAGRYARSASAAFEQTGDRSGLLIARRFEGDAALLNGSLPAARAAYEEVLRDAPAVFPTAGVHARARLATVARFEGDWVAAERELDAARADAARLDIPQWEHDDAYARAMLALSRGNLDEARDRLRRLDAMVGPRDLASRSDILTRLAEVHVRAGRVAEGEAELMRAGTFVDELRSALPDRELRMSVVEARYLDWDRDLGFATTLAGLVTAGSVPTAFHVSEQRRARLLLEGLVRRQALAGKRADAPAPFAPLSEAEARRVLPDSTAVLAFVTGLGREPTTVFILTRERIVATVVAPVDDHAADLGRFAGLLAAGVYPSDLARRLGDAFLRAPLELVPPDVRRLVIVPDGALHRTPFDAIALGDGATLMERYAVTLAPSVTVAVAWWRARPRGPRPRLLAFGDPAGARLITERGDSIPPRLPVAGREARNVARFAARSSVFIGPDAREARLHADSLGDVGVLHFATHADVEEWSLLQSALLLAPGDGQDGRLTAEELLELPIGANLVVLSACRSGSGAVRAGEGLHGLTIPLLEAGAASVLATLWPVGDRTVEPMIGLFYRELASGATVGDALHRARLTAYRDGLSPATWAAFTLTGDPRVVTDLRQPRRATFVLIPAILLALGLVYWGAGTVRRRNAE